MSLIATVACVAAIIGLFFLDRDSQVRTSKALWIPVMWLLIVGSRPVSKWFQGDTPASLAKQFAEGSPIDATVFGVLIVAGILVLNYRKSLVTELLRANAPLLLFFSFCALSILWSDYPVVAAKRWFKAIGDIVMILIVLSDPNPLGATKRLLKRAAFLLLPLSILLIMYYPNLGSFYDPSSNVTYYSGVTTQKNELGEICLVCGLGTLWSFLGALGERKMLYRLRHLFAHGVVLAAAVGLVVKADSMTSLACFAMAGAVMVMTTRGTVALPARDVHVMVGGSVFLALFAVFIDSAGTLVHSLGRNATLTGRTSIWKAVLSMHTNPLFGAGFESFWLGSRLQKVWDMTQQGIGEAHNGYLEIYLNLGWIGLAFLGAAIVAGYGNTLLAYRRDPHAGRLRLAFFTACMIYSLTEAGFRMMSPIWIGFLLAITCVPLSAQLTKSKQTKTWSLTQAAAGRARILQ